MQAHHLNPLHLNQLLRSDYSHKIGEFEKSLLQKLNTKGLKILDSIRKDKSISDETDQALKDVLDQLVKNFS